MRKRSTSSSRTYIMDDIDVRTIRKYKKHKPTPYPVTVPEHKTLKLLAASRVRHPKLVKNRLRYFEEEYIEGNRLVNKIDNTILIKVLTNYIYELRNVNASPISSYIKWNNNTEFFHYQIDYFKAYAKKYKFREKLEKMGLDDNLIDVFKTVKMDDNRKMYLIHGNFCKDNIIERHGDYYVIDWETATYGDIAYEIAMHFSKEKYTEEQMKILIDRLCATLTINPNLLIRDIRMYENFEKIRICFEKLNLACTLQKERKDFREALDDAYQSYMYLAIAKSKDELKGIIVS